MAAPFRVPRLAVTLLPLAGMGAAALALAYVGERAGQALAVAGRGAAAPGRAQEPVLGPRASDAGASVATGAAGALDAAMLRSSRFAPDGAIVAPPEDESYACLQPDVPIARDPGCDEGAAYPRCRWQLPDERSARGLYRVWRNTTPEHRWARPGLVSLVLAAAREYRMRWPGEQLTVGDLDAAGPRHQTHDRGVDVDLYLEHAMIAQNIGGGRYPDNYRGRPARIVGLLRARVLDLARILASCARGRLRIYYNDPEVVSAFRQWFEARGLVSDVGPPMMQHNPLHRFHFHVTVAEDLAPLPIERATHER